MRLGAHIAQTDERNTDAAITNLLGVSIEKRFVPSIANTVGTDLSRYKVVNPGEFAYGPVTSRNGDKVSIARLKGEKCIISSSYTSFRVVGDELNPDYLMLWFMRPEFDRYARFKSHGSAREIFDWEQLCEVDLPIPSLDKQKKIVDSYVAIENRIDALKRLNDKLAAATQFILDEGKKRSQTARVVKLSDISTMQYGYTESATTEAVGPKFLRITDITSDNLDWNEVPYCQISDENLRSYELEAGDIVVARTGVNSGRARYFERKPETAVFASFLVRIKATDQFLQTFLGLEICSARFYQFIQANAAAGSQQLQANPPLLGQYVIELPDKDKIRWIEENTKSYLRLIEANEHEQSKLKKARRELLHQLA